ncbi:MAG: nickel insertion protein, partial [Kiloniellaceae bacterium]
DIDDLTPEFVPPALEALRATGALDVSAHPVAMKKGRPGTRIEALVPADRRLAASEALFAHTTTIGLRFWPVEREILRRAGHAPLLGRRRCLPVQLGPPLNRRVPGGRLARIDGGGR